MTAILIACSPLVAVWLIGVTLWLRDTASPLAAMCDPREVEDSSAMMSLQGFVESLPDASTAPQVKDVDTEQNAPEASEGVNQADLLADQSDRQSDAAMEAALYLPPAQMKAKLELALHLSKQAKTFRKLADQNPEQ